MQRSIPIRSTSGMQDMVSLSEVQVQDMHGAVGLNYVTAQKL